MSNKDQDIEIMEKPLLHGENDGRPQNFDIEKDELCSMFEPDNIKDHKSIPIFKRLGGLEGVQEKLKVRIGIGLNGQDATDITRREEQFGDNQPIVKPQTTICELITEQFGDKILQILCLAAFISTVIGVVQHGWASGWLEGMAIFVAVIIIVSVTAGNNYLKDKQFRKLYAQADVRNVNVVRNGQVENICVYNLVVGDIMQIDTGEILPVDGLIFKSNDMVADESSITGESDPIKKGFPLQLEENSKIQPWLISGSKIMEGSGEMIVMAVGRSSQYGKMKESLQDTSDITPLTAKLNDLADDIGRVGMVVATLIFVCMIGNLTIDKLFVSKEPLFVAENIEELVNFFIISVTMIVVCVPEGLPLAVTIALAYSVGKMKDENNLVRFLYACETMGGANNVCSDKTGTLTKNSMTVTHLYALDKTFQQKFEADRFTKEYLDQFCVGLCVNSSAYPKIIQDKFEHIGNKTECALLEMCYQLGYKFNQYRPSDNIVKIVPFSSERKRMSVVWKLGEGKYRIFCKGAIDFIQGKCKSYIDASSTKQSITKEYLEKLKQHMITFADQSLRTLLITYKDIDISEKDLSGLSDDDIETDLVILGLVGIKDPLRDGIKEAVQTCKEAGVKVRMITGDVQETAVAIAKEAGILDENFSAEGDNYYQVMQGKKFREFVGGLKKTVDPDDKNKTIVQVGNLDNFEMVARSLKVMARSTPEDKYLLIVGLKQMNEVVAVTGDGTNDAPALKKADVGFAMGIAGTEVAKEAAGIILLDDNFKSIVTAIKYGRNIFDCIRKFLQFQLTINCCAMFLVFFGGVVIRESPINAIQMLWVNLIMDTLASLALATEPPNDELLKRKPYSRNEYIITALMWRNVIGHAVWQISVLIVILFWGPSFWNIPSSIHQRKWHPETGRHYTMLFNVFVLLQVFNQINARKLKKDEYNVFRGFFNNGLFFFVMIFTLAIQYLLVTYAGQAVRCTPLTLDQHLICLGIGSTSLVVGLIIKLIPEACFSQIKLFRDQPKVVEDESAPKEVGPYSQPREFMRSSVAKRYNKQPSQNLDRSRSQQSSNKDKKIQVETIKK